MANVWYSVNKDLLEFKEAVLKKVLELKERLKKYATGHETCDASTQTLLTQGRVRPTSLVANAVPNEDRDSGGDTACKHAPYP